AATTSSWIARRRSSTTDWSRASRCSSCSTEPRSTGCAAPSVRTCAVSPTRTCRRSGATRRASSPRGGPSSPGRTPAAPGGGSAGAVRGSGEPIDAHRAGDELVECHVHEALLNRAFDDVTRDFWLLCPYDASALAPTVVDTAHGTHPYVTNGDGRRRCGRFNE